MRSDKVPCGRAPTMRDWRYCQEIARHHGRSFYLASRILPPARQRGVIAAYAYCRIADDIVDRVSTDGPEATASALEQWEAQVSKPTHPVAIAFAHTRDKYDIPLQPVLDLLTGVRMDMQAVRYESWEALQTYCFHVAGTVGLIVAPILGCRDQGALRHAAELGIAMQLTNILRDVAEDAAMQRLYLPADEIDAFGCDAEAILAGRAEQGFVDLIAFQVERARELYASALQGVPALAPSGRIATLAASRLYSGILNEIEELEYDVFRTRAVVPTQRRLRSVARASLSTVAMSFTRRTYPSSRAGEHVMTSISSSSDGKPSRFRSS